jgi:hypothetical protein
MAFSRAFDDPLRIMTQVKQSTDPCCYYLNQPGVGAKPYFIEDPHVIIQTWGANLHENKVGIESELMGLNQSTIRDIGKLAPLTNKPISYPTYLNEVTVEPRTIQPAWTLRGALIPSRAAILPLNPQDTAIIPFHQNISTRILEKNSMLK